MRLRWGHVPENPDFRPLEEGWNPVREPRSMLGLMLVALPAGIVGFLGVGLLANGVGLAEEISIQFDMPFLAALILTIPVHELMHAAVFPGSIMSPNVTIGMTPNGLAAYAHYEGPMTRERFLLVLMTPLVALTAVMFIAAWLLPAVAPRLVGLAVVHAFFCGGDLFGTILAWLQVPRRATVRNRGILTYWLPVSIDNGAPTGSTSSRIGLDDE